MPDCFISYSSTDEELARFVETHLRAQGLDVFLASVSLQPRERWSEAI
jgi:TIR domain